MIGYFIRVRKLGSIYNYNGGRLRVYKCESRRGFYCVNLGSLKRK